MTKITKYTLIIVSLAVLFLAGCEDRGTNIPNDSSIKEVYIAPMAHDFYPELNFQIRNEFRLMEMAVYIPKIAFPKDWDGEFRSVPLLVLLPPQDGDQYYYFNHGLQQAADELIENGTIEPMIICCITNDKAFGGYFYSSSIPAGDYDAILGNKLVAFLQNSFPQLLRTPAKRGIGGVGMGAYGAFRTAIKSPGIYTSVSASDGPLDFDGADNESGLMDLFDDALAEQGLDASSFKEFDTTGSWFISRLFVGGSLAFSPHDTLIYSHTRVMTDPNSGSQILQVIQDSTLTYDDNETLITDVVAGLRNFDFHLPFDGNGNVYNPVWQRWLKNNLENLLQTAGVGALAGVELQIISTPEARYGYYNMTKSWINTLNNPPYSYKIDLSEYTGYDGNPATHDQYLYEVLKKMLIFHSKNFNN